VAHYCVTKREALERALHEAQARILEGITNAEQERYFDPSPTLGELRSNDGDQPLQGNHALPPRGYPIEVKRLAVQMADAGKPSPEICEAILAAHGKTLGVSNLGRQVRRWRVALQDG